MNQNEQNWPKLLTFFAQFSLISADALAFAADTMAMAIAIGHLAFVVPQLTFFTFPAGIALTFAIDVFTALRAQHRAHTYGVFMGERKIKEMRKMQQSTATVN